MKYIDRLVNDLCNTIDTLTEVVKNLKEERNRLQEENLKLINEGIKHNETMMSNLFELVLNSNQETLKKTFAKQKKEVTK